MEESIVATQGGISRPHHDVISNEEEELTDLVFLRAEPLEITPRYFIHRVWGNRERKGWLAVLNPSASMGAGECRRNRRSQPTYQYLRGLQLSRNTIRIHVSFCITSQLPNMFPFRISSLPPTMGWEDRRQKRTCLAARGSLGMPQPWRKQLANSKMARTSSPLAAPPFLSPACKANCSISAALEAAAER